MVIIQGQRGDLRHLLATLQVGHTMAIVYTVNNQTTFVQRIHAVGTQWVFDMANNITEEVLLGDIPRAVRVRDITVS